MERERREREGGGGSGGGGGGGGGGADPLEQTNGHIYYFTGGQHDYWIKITI